MNSNPSSFVRVYVLWSVACVVCGWTLSALRMLGLPGYAVLLPIVFVGLVWLLRDAKAAPAPVRRRRGRRFVRRFRRPLPLVFLTGTVLVFAGGLLHAPNNYDAITYRLPRILNWLMHGGWYWIESINDRLNYSGTGWEWIAAPLLALRSDRGLFLINALGFVLFPGLIFSVLRRSGISRRAAWAWMWILPMGFGFALQAGSIGNDLTGTLFCLIAVYYGLRARETGRWEDLGLSIFAAGFMTGIKASNLPLALPCLVAILPVLKQLLRHPVKGLIVALIAVLISAIPMAALNQRYAGGWTGDPQNRQLLKARSPVAALLGNGIFVGEQLLMPPFLFRARQVNEWVDRQLPGSWRRKLEKDYPRYSMQRMNELPQEELAGLGLGIATLLAVAIGAAIGRRKNGGAPRSPRIRPWVGIAAWISALVFLTNMGIETAARLLLPYYPLLIIPILALPGQDWLARRVGWRILAALAALSIVPVLIFTPSRPLWPAQAFSEHWASRHPNSALAQRMKTVYSIYRNRNDLLAPLRNQLPDTATNIGMIIGDNDSDYSFWHPLGRRRVTYLWKASGITPTVPPEINYIVVNEMVWPSTNDLSFQQWAAKQNFESVYSTPIVPFFAVGEQPWFLLRRKQP